MSTVQPSLLKDQAPSGTAFALSAYLIWGLTPLYWKLLADIPSLEVLLHRTVWSFLFLFPIVLLSGRARELFAAVKKPKILATLFVTAFILAGNWFTFIWAIANNRVLETSLGYYINPLVNVLLGMVVLKERLRPMQALAVALAAAGVGLMTWRVGSIPWPALVLAFSFAFYGLIRKTADVGPLVGLTVETFYLSIPGLILILKMHAAGTGAFPAAGMHTCLLLAGTALVTGPPLLLFNLGAKRLHLSAIGFLQYLSPTCTFFLGIFVFKEPFSMAKAATFALIWAGLFVYSVDSVRAFRTAAREKARPAA